MSVDTSITVTLQAGSAKSMPHSFSFLGKWIEWHLCQMPGRKNLLLQLNKQVASLKIDLNAIGLKRPMRMTLTVSLFQLFGCSFDLIPFSLSNTNFESSHLPKIVSVAHVPSARPVNKTE